MTDRRAQDERFRAAVAEIDAGDVDRLRATLTADPALLDERLEAPGSWLRDRIGNAADDKGFFARPYLLWFVAEDPVRNGTLPANIADIARTIVEMARNRGVASLQEQLDYAVSLVSWSWIAAQHGVQIPLLDVLLDAGGKADGNPENALVNGHHAAAHHLIERGARLTMASALCLDRWDDAERIARTATQEQKQFAVVLAGLNGHGEAVRRALSLGADANQKSSVLYSHATPLHHAVCGKSLDAVRALVEAGASLDVTDTVFEKTPLGWAEYYIRTGKSKEAVAAYRAILEYLEGVAASTTR